MNDERPSILSTLMHFGRLSRWFMLSKGMISSTMAMC